MNIRWALLLGWLLAAPTSHAQVSNGTYTIHQETVATSGGRVGGGNPMSAQTIIGLPAAGAASNGPYALLGGAASQSPAPKPITATVTVSGTVDDSTCHVMVNGVAASLASTTFAAEIQLVAGPNTVTAVAADEAGNSRSSSITVHVDLPTEQKVPRFSIPVAGTVNEPATVVVNGVPAAVDVSSGTFSAGVLVTSGYNTITATATDLANNVGAPHTIRVYVMPVTRPPAKPTVGTVGGPIPQVATGTSMTLGGTKTPGTSIWINGAQVVAMNDETTWSIVLTLVEGDNELTILAKDAAGASSTNVTISIIVDTAPPIVTFQPAAKTNLTPFSVSGTVDDSLTTVVINGLTAGRTKRNFSVAVPLALGLNTLQLTATSPNGYVTQRTYQVTLGTIPAIQSSQPVDGTTLYAGTSVTLQATATDLEGDAVEHQFLIDGVVVGGWGSVASTTWTPAQSQFGLHQVTVGVRDAYGGSNTKDVDVFVVRPPVQHP